MHMRKTVLFAMLAIGIGGCSGLSSQQQRALSGGAIGAAGGAVLGAVVAGSPLTGAVVGGAVGTAVGALATEARKK